MEGSNIILRYIKSRFPSFVYAGNDWNDVSQFGIKTEQAFKGTEETNTSFH